MTALIDAGPVYGPVAKRSRFIFERLESPEELRLDYDVTILPPKKLFFPPAQDLVRFDGDEYSAIDPEEKVLLGVHFYDVKGLDQTDLLYSERNFDVNYMANRQTTTIVASNIQNVSDRAFFASVGADVPAKGHDAFLTSIAGGYVFEPLTERGEALLKHGTFLAASEAQVAEAEKVNAEALTKCKEKHEHGAEEIAAKVRAAFGNEDLWSELAARTASRAVPATRSARPATASTCRTPGTSTPPGSAPATGTPASRRISPGLARRRRHRELPRQPRRALPSPLHAQVGVPERQAGPAGLRRLRPVLGRLYGRHRRPRPGHRPDHGVVRSPQMSHQCHWTKPSTSSFLVRRRSCRPCSRPSGEALHAPDGRRGADGVRARTDHGLGLLGYGEIPIGFASSPTHTDSFDVVVRSVGRVSKAINQNEGDSLQVRGPLGHGFDLDKLRGQDVLIVAGGIGLCPTRSLIQYILDRRDEFNRFVLFYGTREPCLQLFTDDLACWRGMEDVEYYETVDKGDPSWTGNVGVITTLFPKVELVAETRAVICGPPIFYRFVVRELDRSASPTRTSSSTSSAG